MPTHKLPTTFSLNPLTWLAVSFACGIASAQYFHLPLSVTLILSSALSFATLVLRDRRLATPMVIAAFAMLGAFSFSLERGNIRPDRVKELFANGILASGEPTDVEGTLIGYPEPAPDGIFFVLNSRTIRVRSREQPVSGRVRFFLPLQNEEAAADVRLKDLRYGSRVRVTCRLLREDQFLNPGVMRRTELLDRQGIDATANLKSPLLIEPSGRDAVFVPLDIVYKLRVDLVERFRSMFQATTAGILIASAFGNKYFLDKRTADIFREGGTFHVLVISGLHITFIGGFVLLIVRLFTPRRVLQTAAVLTILWLYGVAVGAEPPVIRACVMFTILMIGYAAFRTSTLLNSLGGCVLILLVWKPSDLFDPSFQLTSASVAGIICIGLPLLAKLHAIGEWLPSAKEPLPPNVPDRLRSFCETIYWRPAAWRIEQTRNIWSANISKTPFLDRNDELGLRRVVIFLFDGIVISVAVQLVLLPFTVVYFHRVTFASIFLNLWVGPLLAIESIAAFIAALIGTFSNFAAIPFVGLTEALNWLLVSAPAILKDGGWASFRVPVYPDSRKAVYFVYFIPIVAFAFIVARWDPFTLNKVRRKTKLFTAASAALAMIFAAMIVFHPMSTRTHDGLLKVEFLDVGQGDAAFITFPKGTTMLVDAGGRMTYGEDDDFDPDVPRIGEAVVSEFLWEKGISRIDHIVATHADADHIQGLVDVVKNFNIGNAYFGVTATEDSDLAELLATVGQEGIPVSSLFAGDRFEVDGVRIDVSNPSSEKRITANNDSVVLRLAHGDISFLLTGDIEREAEELILQSGSEFRSTVLKVPHHGSRSSSTDAFVNAVQPEIAVISVGRRSQFGHPHPDVLERWERIGSRIETTGRKGTITISTDGRVVDVQAFVLNQ